MLRLRIHFYAIRFSHPYMYTVLTFVPYWYPPWWWQATCWVSLWGWCSTCQGRRETEHRERAGSSPVSQAKIFC